MPDDEICPPDVARQVRELWAHVPGDLRPGEDDIIEVRTGRSGRVIVCHGGNVFHLRDGKVHCFLGRAGGRAAFVECRDGVVVPRAELN